MKPEPTNEIFLRAPAKINLGLEVLRRRPDGYHDINTVFAAVDVFDDILLRPRHDGRITCMVEGSPDLEEGEGNLCVRAALALRRAVGDETLGLDILLIKRIPMGAGLGGGSSDAAAVLRGAIELWGLAPDGDLPDRIAAGLGSDVPFFLYGGMVHATSRGELLTPVDLMLPYVVVLVNPGIHVPTPWAYHAVGCTGERAAGDLIAALRHSSIDPAALRSGITNDFEEGVFPHHPLLPELKERLYDAGALLALMSGSGSTMYGLFADHHAAAGAAGRFREHWTAVARFLPPGDALVFGGAGSGR